VKPPSPDLRPRNRFQKSSRKQSISTALTIAPPKPLSYLKSRVTPKSFRIFGFLHADFCSPAYLHAAHASLWFSRQFRLRLGSLNYVQLPRKSVHSAGIPRVPTSAKRPWPERHPLPRTRLRSAVGECGIGEGWPTSARFWRMWGLDPEPHAFPSPLLFHPLLCKND